MVEMVPLIGFAPDLPPTTPGVIVSCTNLVPRATGFSAVRELVNQSNALPGGLCYGAFSDDERPNLDKFAGTLTGLYQLVASAWVDKSRTVGGPYTGISTATRWVFAPFGEFTLASNGADPIQVSPYLGVRFEDIPGAPVAKVLFPVGDFVMALNTGTTASTLISDQWHCSGIFDHTVWTPSVSTQCNTGRLVQTGGAFIAGLALGKQAVGYKEQSIYLGTYVGGAAVWQWELASDRRGAVGPHAVCDVDGIHYFVAIDGVFSFDGVSVRPVAPQISNWLRQNLSFGGNAGNKTSVVYEPTEKCLWVCFQNRQGTGIKLPIHLESMKVGKVELPFLSKIEAVLVGFGALVSTGTKARLLDFSGGVLRSHSGTTSVTATLRTGYIGGSVGSRRCSALHARFTNSTAAGTSCVVRAYPGEPSEGNATSAAGANFSRGRYDLKASGHWFDADISFNSTVVAATAGGVFPNDVDLETTISGVGLDLAQGGAR